MNIATRIYIAIFLVSLTVTLASVLLLEIFSHPTAALVLHPCIVMVTIIRSELRSDLALPLLVFIKQMSTFF